MRKPAGVLSAVGAIGLAVLLTACGGSNSNSGGGGGGGGSGAKLSGSVATGLALAGAQVDGKCTTGTLSGTTDTKGAYTIDAGAVKFPCLMRATSADGKTKLHSVAAATGTANITSLTEVATAKLLGAQPAAKFDAFDAATVSAVGAVVQDDLTKVMTATADFIKTQYGVNISNLLPQHFTTPFTPASTGVTGDATDKVLDDLFTELKAKSKTLDQLSADFVAGKASAPDAPADSASNNAITSSGSLTASKGNKKPDDMTADANRFVLEVDKNSNGIVSYSWLQKVIVDTSNGAYTDRKLTLTTDAAGKVTSVQYWAIMLDGKYPGLGSTDSFYRCYVSGTPQANAFPGFTCGGKVDLQLGAGGHPVAVKLTDVKAFSGLTSVLDSTTLNGSFNADMTAAATWVVDDVIKSSLSGKVDTDIGTMTLGGGVNSHNDTLKYTGMDATKMPAKSAAYMLLMSVNSAGGIESIQVMMTGDGAAGKGGIYGCYRDKDMRAIGKVDLCSGVTVSADRRTITFSDALLKGVDNPAWGMPSGPASIKLNGSVTLK